MFVVNAYDQSGLTMKNANIIIENDSLWYKSVIFAYYVFLSYKVLGFKCVISNITQIA